MRFYRVYRPSGYNADFVVRKIVKKIQIDAYGALNRKLFYRLAYRLCRHAAKLTLSESGTYSLRRFTELTAVLYAIRISQVEKRDLNRKDCKLVYVFIKTSCTKSSQS